MAVATQEKRMSATGVARPYLRAKLPGAIDQAWRMASGHSYSGNAIGTGVTAAEVISLEDVSVVLPRLTNVVVDYL